VSIATRVRIVPAVLSFLAAHAALAQVTTTASAPVPSIIASAQRVFISNGGSDTYGSESYLPRSRYTGGPNRFYNEFYAGMKSWGHFALTDSPANAEVVYEIRFAAPVADQSSQGTHDFIYDPQLYLNVLDPQTRVVLWSLTEHIAPARTASGDNKNFESAVARMVTRVKGLVAGDTAGLAVAEDTRSPELIAVARRAAQFQHTVLGLVIGGAIGTYVGRPQGRVHCDNVATCGDDGQRSMHRQVTYTLSASAIGALVGWLWPTS
jgi:hypothetical protein